MDYYEDIKNDHYEDSTVTRKRFPLQRDARERERVRTCLLVTTETALASLPSHSWRLVQGEHRANVCETDYKPVGPDLAIQVRVGQVWKAR